MNDQRNPFYVCADICVRRWNEDEDTYEILLIKRRPESRAFPGMWALPGGHVDKGEEIYQAAARELAEETGIAGYHLNFVRYFDAPGRDPRGDYISFLFEVEVTSDVQVQAGDDARDIGWFPEDDLPNLAFDHLEMIQAVASMMGFRRSLA